MVCHHLPPVQKTFGASQQGGFVQDTVTIFGRVMLARSVTGIAVIGILNLVARGL
jgi:hypothetical protein